MAIATLGGQAAVTHLGAFDSSALQDVQDTLCEGRQTVLQGVAEAVPFPGVVQLNAAVAEACTLATPVSGPQPLGDDGKTIFIYDNSGKAHTVTTAANKIINLKSTLTFNGTKGSNIELIAQGGIWIPRGTPSGVAIT